MDLFSGRWGRLRRDVIADTCQLEVPNFSARRELRVALKRAWTRNMRPVLDRP